MSVEQHTLSGKAEEVNIFLVALLNFTVNPLQPGAPSFLAFLARRVGILTSPVPPERTAVDSLPRSARQPLPTLPIPLPPRTPALQIRKESQTLHPGKRSHRQQIPNLFPRNPPNPLDHHMRRQHINVGSRISFLPFPACRVNRLHVIPPAVQPARSFNLHPQQPPPRPRPNNKVILLAIAPGQSQPKSQRLCLHQKRRLRQLPHPLGIRPPLLPPPRITIRLRKNPRNKSRHRLIPVTALLAI